ncbi:MAG: hypothetical protein CM1200mP37_6370 [Chloroflexota bacterium]|nr:MAG: hypothetical protein CM1200mP37_6370 [Chloroflexota bacterium]
MYVDLVEDEHLAIAVVPDRQLSLAIGKDGQNARLAAKLTGWTIDIKSDQEYERIPNLSLMKIFKMLKARICLLRYQLKSLNQNKLQKN